MSSLFAALGVAVSGLNAQSQSIGNISDDLSNAQTTGYKSIGTSFSDLVTASSATDNSPGGVAAKPMYQNNVQGNIASTSTSTNLAISGQGFFDVTNASQTATGQTQINTGSNYYTRDGDFTLNQDGYMVNSAGYYLLGYAIKAGVVDTASTAPIQISSLLDNPQPTQTITYMANLPASATNGYNSTSSTVSMYDALGNTHTTSITWEKLATNEWLASISVPDAGYNAQALVTFNDGSVPTDPAGTIGSVLPLTASPAVTNAYNPLGVPPTFTITSAGGSGFVYSAATGKASWQGANETMDIAVKLNGSASNTIIPITLTYGETLDAIAAQINAYTSPTVMAAVAYGGGVGTLTLTNVAGNPGAVLSPIYGGNTTPMQLTPSYTNTASNELNAGEAGLGLTLNFGGTAPQTVDLNLGDLNEATGVTQYANSSSTVSVSSITQDGLGEGSYSSIGIDSSGTVSINYTNGSTREIYQIPIASFNSPDSLQRQSGGVYTATLASGSANLEMPGTNGVGTIASSSLEASDVDIAGEFTTMIQAQQVYSANAKVVSTVNSMLNTIIQAVQ